MGQTGIFRVHPLPAGNPFVLNLLALRACDGPNTTGMRPYIADKLRCECCLNEDVSLFDEKWEKNGAIILACRVCGFVFIPWHYRKDISYTDYKDEAVLRQIRSGNDWLKIQRQLLRFRLIRRYQPTGSLFDLGVGWGHFLLAGKQLGFEVYGIEVSLNPYTYAKEDLKLPVDHIDFFKLEKQNESFDIITLWDVLEHIDEADRMIAKCATLIKKGGYLFIQVPAIDSSIAKQQQVNWKMIGVDHVNYFSRKTITLLLERHGFEVVKIKSSIELKLFLMYTILPWIKRNIGAREQRFDSAQHKRSKGAKETTITSAERQEFYNKTTNRPKWMLRIFVFFHNMIYNLLSFLNIGEEMIVIARRRNKE